MSLVAFCVMAFIATVSAHEVCTYTSLSLGLALNEAGCRDICANHEGGGATGRCFAYTYVPEDEACRGYVFDYDDDYEDTTECQANYGAVLELPEEGTVPAAEDDESCQLSNTSLGPAADSGECSSKCANLESRAHAGCAAWFYDPEEQECTGLLAEFDGYTTIVCGVLSA